MFERRDPSIIKGGLTYRYEVNVGRRGLLLEVAWRIKRCGIARLIVVRERWNADRLLTSSIYVAEPDVEDFRKVFAQFKQVIDSLSEHARLYFLGEAEEDKLPADI